ncbi:hypothetical protein K474DRAFT_1675090 [Panus rudis PR-1116 ss-1]|nr:hypothetical protein K474DRAFT_1675090 [Panus rudis PR-1116 ss-1]
MLGLRRSSKYSKGFWRSLTALDDGLFHLPYSLEAVLRSFIELRLSSTVQKALPLAQPQVFIMPVIITREGTHFLFLVLHSGTPDYLDAIMLNEIFYTLNGLRNSLDNVYTAAGRLSRFSSCQRALPLAQLQFRLFVRTLDSTGDSFFSNIISVFFWDFFRFDAPSTSRATLQEVHEGTSTAPTSPALPSIVETTPSQAAAHASGSTALRRRRFSLSLAATQVAGLKASTQRQTAANDAGGIGRNRTIAGSVVETATQSNSPFGRMRGGSIGTSLRTSLSLKTAVVDYPSPIESPGEQNIAGYFWREDPVGEDTFNEN